LGGASFKVVAVGVSVGAIALYSVAVFVGQRALLFPRPGVGGVPSRPLDAQQIWFGTEGARVEAWYLPPRPHLGAAPLVIYFHGNGELIDFLPADFDLPRAWGLGVLLVEFPGYGRSDGTPSQASIGATARSAYDWAIEQPEVDGSRIVAYGRSLGGASAAILAATRPAAALVLESTFTSVRSFAHGLFVPEFMVRDPFDSLSLVRTYARPVLVFHGERDEVVPFDHGQQLAAAARLAEFHRLPCGHNDCPKQWPVIRKFLEVNRLLPP
jgi:fermentation-respiration switch protein FrsA (DUF1100 family)